jgi:hypothetical protein
MDDQFKIGQLTKELVALRLKELGDPCAVAAGLVKKTLVVALKAQPDQAPTVVSDACYGGLQGLLLAEQDMSRGAVLILEAVCDSANDTALDPTAMMRYGLAGIARVSKFVPSETLVTMRHALEERYNGIGEAFSEALSAEQAKTPAA